MNWPFYPPPEPSRRSRHIGLLLLSVFLMVVVAKGLSYLFPMRLQPALEVSDVVYFPEVNDTYKISVPPEQLSLTSPFHTPLSTTTFCIAVLAYCFAWYSILRTSGYISPFFSFLINDE